MRCVFFVFITFMANAVAAPVPKLAMAPSAIICEPNVDGNEWRPTKNDIQAVENAIPSFFRALKRKSSELPNPLHRYARHYTGVLQNGKRYIVGRYYPALLPEAKEIGERCGVVDDGGNDFWSLEFDPSTGAVVSFGVNFSA